MSKRLKPRSQRKTVRAMAASPAAHQRRVQFRHSLARPRNRTSVIKPYDRATRRGQHCGQRKRHWPLPASTDGQFILDPPPSYESMACPTCLRRAFLIVGVRPDAPVRIDRITVKRTDKPRALVINAVISAMNEPRINWSTQCIAADSRGLAIPTVAANAA
jgi:hypothetical protein